MNLFLEQKWREAKPPFDGITVESRGDIKLSTMRTALVSVVNILYKQRPYSQLFQLSDWHEHDGYVTESQPSSWQSLFFLLSTDEALYAAREEDSYVRTCFYPDDYTFYLRIYVVDEYDRPHQNRIGNWDLTLGQAVTSQILQELHSYGVMDTQSSQAKFFLMTDIEVNNRRGARLQFLVFVRAQTQRADARILAYHSFHF